MSHPQQEFDFTPIKSRYQEMYDECVEFVKEYPIAWTLFVQFSFKYIRMGRETYSVNAIFEEIRHWTDQPDYEDDAFKLNNNYRAYFARWFMLAYPEHDGFFRLRHQISHEEDATGLPPLGPEYFERPQPDDEFNPPTL